MPPVPVAYPTDDEKNMAMLSYILSIFSGWLAPLVIWLIKRDSKFVSFHALQILFWHCIYLVLTMIAMMFFMVGMIGSVAAGAHNRTAGPPPAFFLFMPVFVMIFWGGWLINMIVGVIYAIKAKNGEWSRLVFVGRLARRAAGLSPD